MTFLSAGEDFRLRTLASIRSQVARLAYLTSIRTMNRYEHWGMAKRFGEVQAENAIAAAHTEVFVDVLSSPLQKIFDELHSANAVSAEYETPLALLKTQRQLAVPADGAGSNRSHFSFVLESLLLVEKAERASSPQAA